MNFTFTIKQAFQWGSFVNGEWNGMVGMLYQKRYVCYKCHKLKLDFEIDQADNGISNLISRYVD